MPTSQARAGLFIAAALIGASLIVGCTSPASPPAQPAYIPKPIDITRPDTISQTPPAAAGPSTGARPPTPEPSAPRPSAPGPSLNASSWYWLGTIGGTEFASPADPGNFNLEFLDGGQLAAQVDCNRGSSSWQQDGASLRISPLATTRMTCSPGSEAARFGRQLQQVRSAAMVRGLLELSTEDAGTMVFARDPEWRLSSYDCPGGSRLRVAVGRGQAVVRLRRDTWALNQQSVGSGQRFAEGNAILIVRGPDANLIVDGRQIAGPCSNRR
jgi:heat shock protein HslJ